MRILAPLSSLSSMFAPSIDWSRMPLNLAIRIEKDVRGILGGTIFDTLPKAWLSVMTILTLPTFSRAIASSVSLTTTGIAPLPKRSLITICCGRMSLSFGADLSIGTTSTTRSPSSTRSDTRGRVLRSRMMTATFSLSSSMPSPLRALTDIEFSTSGIVTSRSLLLNTTR